MEKKMTQKEMFDYIEKINENDELIVKFCEERKAVLERKSSSKTETKTQKENNELIEVIVETLTELGKAVRITELQSANEKLAELSNQKMSALLKKLVDTNKVNKVMEKRVAYFSLVD